MNIPLKDVSFLSSFYLFIYVFLFNIFWAYHRLDSDFD